MYQESSLCSKCVAKFDHLWDMDSKRSLLCLGNLLERLVASEISSTERIMTGSWPSPTVASFVARYALRNQKSKGRPNSMCNGTIMHWYKYNILIKDEADLSLGPELARVGDPGFACAVHGRLRRRVPSVRHAPLAGRPGVARWEIDRVMREVALVIAGNPYIADRAAAAGAWRVEILPTVVDLSRYPPSPPPENLVFAIVWIRTPQTQHYLEGIQPALERVCADGGARLVAIGATGLRLGGVPLEAKPWSEGTEAGELRRIDVGIMPLPDCPFGRGKCGLKLIQYMACSRPVVGTPVGVNREIITDGLNGYQATSEEEWVETLVRLRRERGLRIRTREAGRARVEYHCLKVAAPRLASLLESAALGQAAPAANRERSEASTPTGVSVHGTEVGYPTTRHREATL